MCVTIHLPNLQPGIHQLQQGSDVVKRQHQQCLLQLSRANPLHHREHILEMLMKRRHLIG